MRELARECARCGTGFSYTYAGVGGKRKYCSPQCARNAAPRSDCGDCGKSYLLRSSGEGRCRPCARLAERVRDRALGVCEHCTAEFSMRVRRQRFCSAQCREAHYRAEKVAQMKAAGTYVYCARCGGDKVQRPNKSHCDAPACAAEQREAARLRINASNRAYMRRYKERTGLSNAQRYRDRDYNKNYNYRERYPDRAKHYDHVRRARMANCERESFPDSLIFERDEWVCGICSEPVDRHLKYPDPKSASLDHIIPLSKGGGHTMDNVQLAHFGCNCRKHDKLPDDLVAAN